MILPKNIHNETILFTVLNWGLGHASRSVSIIKQLIQQGNKLILASDGDSKKLLKEEFPELPVLDLPAYNITYSSAGWYMPITLLLQVSKIKKTIAAEHLAIIDYVNNHKVTYIISDNRYGCHHSSCTNIFITHQLQLAMPLGFGLLSNIFKRVIAKLISPFQYCWIPDYEHENNLSGKLSHIKNLPKNYCFIGPQTRFKKGVATDLYDLIIVLSGPEPQRTILENKLLVIINQLTTLKIILIRGTTKECNSTLAQHLTVFDLVESNTLNQYLLQSKKIICRSGYSTLMDLDLLQKSALLIATPGQTEQEYLANVFSKKNDFFVLKQNEITKQKILKYISKN